MIFELLLKGWRVRKALFGLLSAVFCSLVSAQAGNRWKIIHAGSLLARCQRGSTGRTEHHYQKYVVVDVRDGYVAPGEVQQRMRR